ncbi:MAG: hypothetical protein QNL62_18050 [Gammaproteobacteria bacterium]|nr:hypothetical protein [Gammaproteobacteria bacterium]
MVSLIVSALSAKKLTLLNGLILAPGSLLSAGRRHYHPSGTRTAGDRD